MLAVKRDVLLEERRSGTVKQRTNTRNTAILFDRVRHLIADEVPPRIIPTRRHLSTGRESAAVRVPPRSTIGPQLRDQCVEQGKVFRGTLRRQISLITFA